MVGGGAQAGHPRRPAGDLEERPRRRRRRSQRLTRAPARAQRAAPQSSPPSPASSIRAALIEAADDSAAPTATHAGFVAEAEHTDGIASFVWTDERAGRLDGVRARAGNADRAARPRPAAGQGLPQRRGLPRPGAGAGRAAPRASAGRTRGLAGRRACAAGSSSSPATSPSRRCARCSPPCNALGRIDDAQSRVAALRWHIPAEAVPKRRALD